ncbi:hypothetical protein MCP_1272 [Methanocella paludicola SANAE]|uniref:HdeD family acid-resistance protein n=1 Tax=Methanocella paludicola (strain DSM 17711 / JCM 13418 / NBRC 101707 / SANAE) TaxID=304371 RepID=D1YY22_METPS|nr:DUF308 domain-containing protein [Methanocella paludicola]BAI61344.1 hypothetical protein MCP_1272 [Methanocella paludicola SANAE]
MAESVSGSENLGIGLWSAHWLNFLLRGLIALGFGLILLFFPGLTLLTFIMLFAVFAFVVGVLLLLEAVSIRDGRWWLRIIEGVIGIAAAAAVILWPGLTLLTFALIVAFYFLLTGVLDVIVAVETHKRVHGEWLLIAGGILAGMVGVILLIYPIAGLVTLIQVVGIFSIAFGLIMVLLAIKLKLTGPRAPAAA